MSFLIVFLGAGLGGALRHGVNLAVARLGASFPYGTLSVNILGSFVMGALVEYLAVRAQLPQGWRLFLATGVLGGFTTFSAFSLDAVLLYERGQPGAAVSYVLASVVLSLAAFVGALLLVRQFVRI